MTQLQVASGMKLYSLYSSPSRSSTKIIFMNNNRKTPYVMVFNSVPYHSQLLALAFVAVELTVATHFRGATIQWRPVDPANFDGRVSREHNSVMQSEGSSHCMLLYRISDTRICFYLACSVSSIYVDCGYPSYCLAKRFSCWSLL